MTTTTTKAGYESIPDVEQADVVKHQHAKRRYPDLNDEQADLIFSYDEVIEGSGVSLALAISQTSPEDMMSQGVGYLESIIAPTSTSICTFAAALYLQTMGDVGPWIRILFPYVNATVVFCSSVAPMQNRFMSAAVPIFDNVDRVQEKVEKSVEELRDAFDSTLDTLKGKSEKAMKPIKATLAKAKALEPQIKQACPDIELPPDQDLDAEFYAMRELVDPKLDEAQKMLQLDQHIPWFLRTPNDFFWYVVFPILLIALLLQLGMAWLTNYLALLSPPPWGDVDVGVVEDGTNGEALRRMMQGAVGSFQDQAHSAQDQLQAYQNQAQDRFNVLQEQARDPYRALQDQAQQNEDDLKTQFDAAVAKSTVLLINVAVSYIMSLLQIGFAFLFLSPVVRASVISQLTSVLANHATNVLRENGVETALQDVFQKKLTQTRSALVKYITTAEEIDKALGPGGILGGGEDTNKDHASSPSVLSSDSSNPTSSSGKKKHGLLGFIFGGHKSPKHN